MKRSNNIISDWLNEYGDPEIDKKVKMELERINKERYNQIIDELYENYSNKYWGLHYLDKIEYGSSYYNHDTGEYDFETYSKKEFVDRCKTNKEFSERWGLKIDEKDEL